METSELIYHIINFGLLPDDLIDDLYEAIDNAIAEVFGTIYDEIGIKNFLFSAILSIELGEHSFSERQLAVKKALNNYEKILKLLSDAAKRMNEDEYYNYFYKVVENFDIDIYISEEILPKIEEAKPENVEKEYKRFKKEKNNYYAKINWNKLTLDNNEGAKRAFEDIGLFLSGNIKQDVVRYAFR